MANNIDLTICAPKPSFRRFRCFAWLILRSSPTGTSAPKRSCSRFASLTLRTPHRPPVSLCFSPKRTTFRFASLSLRTPHHSPVSLCFSPKRTTFRFASLTLRTPHRPPVSLCFSGRLIFRLRTEPALRAAPVFRMAYSAPTAHRAVSSETLMLQVRFAHPPNCAPSSRFFVLFSKTHDLQVRFAHPPNCAPLSRFFVLFRSAYFPSPHRTSSSSCSGVPHGLFFRKSTLCFFFQNAHASGSLRSPSELRTVLPFLCAFLQNARPSGSLRSPSVSAPKPSFRRFRCFAWLILRFRTIAHTGAGVSLGLFGKPKRSSFSRIRGLHRSAPRCLL